MEDALEYLKKINEELDKLNRGVETKIKVNNKRDSIYDEVNPSLLR